jgi:integrase
LRRIADALDTVPESVYAGAAAHGLSRGDLAGAFMNTRKEAKEFEKRVALTRKVLRLETGRGLTSLVVQWQATNKPRAPKSIDKMHLAVRYFVEAIGDMAPKDVTADHVGAFRDALERRQGMGGKTALKHLQGLNTLFNVAASERKFGVKANPCANITVRKSGGKLVDLGSKKPLQPAQIRTIFEKMSTESEEFQWMVRLLTYHGCRTSEAAQLRVDDVTDSFGDHGPTHARCTRSAQE